MSYAWPSVAECADFSLETSAGYNDNPAQTNNRKGSGFIFHRAGLSDTWQLGGGASFMGLLEGSYQNYTRVGDNYFLKARGELTRPVLGSRLVPALLMEANSYRDDYMPEDDRDQYLAGLRLSWIYSRFMTLSLEGTYSRLNYKNSSYSYAEPQGQEASAAGLLSPAGSGSGTEADLQDLSVVKTSRNDHLTNGDFICDLFLTPTVYGSILTGYSRLHSTDDFETYRQVHASTRLTWDMTEVWRLQLESGLWRTAYDESPLHTNRTDKTFFAGAQVSRFFGPVEVYGKMTWLKNNSKVNSEFYHQMVTQCGFSWYF